MPKERLTKHFLTKVINKLNSFIELSDYQVTAYLMNMPSIITSEIFQYCEKITISKKSMVESAFRIGMEFVVTGFGRY